MSRNKGQSITVWLPDDTVALLDRLAVKAEVPRSRLIRNIVEVNASELEKMDQLGLWKFSCILRDLRMNLRSWVRSVQEEPELFGAYADDEEFPEALKQCNGGKGCNMPCAST